MKTFWLAPLSDAEREALDPNNPYKQEPQETEELTPLTPARTMLATWAAIFVVCFLFVALYFAMEAFK